MGCQGFHYGIGGSPTVTLSKPNTKWMSHRYCRTYAEAPFLREVFAVVNPAKLSGTACPVQCPWFPSRRHGSLPFHCSYYSSTIAATSCSLSSARTSASAPPLSLSLSSSYFSVKTAAWTTSPCMQQCIQCNAGRVYVSAYLGKCGCSKKKKEGKKKKERENIHCINVYLASFARRVRRHPRRLTHFPLPPDCWLWVAL